MTIDITPENSEGLIVNRATVVLANRGFTIVSTQPDISVGNVVLAPGEKFSVTVAFKPTKEGAHMATLSIGSNDERNATISIPLRGTGQTQVSVGEQETMRSKLYLFAAPTVVSDESIVSFGVDTPAPIPAKITVVNSIGSEVAVLHDGMTNGDVQTVVLPARTLSAGVYYIVMSAGGATTSVPVTIVK